MDHGADQNAKRVYVDSLRWRQRDLQGKVEAISRQIVASTRDEAELKQHLRAVEQLLSAEGEPSEDPQRPKAPLPVHIGTSIDRGNGREPSPEHPPLSLGQWGPKSRAIYMAAAEVIRDAGVPLHYRVLAEEVRKRVALSGVDPGATLLAHLHRAQDVFPRVGRGIYGLQEMVAATPRAEGPTSAPATRRRKTRRRTR